MAKVNSLNAVAVAAAAAEGAIEDDYEDEDWAEYLLLPFVTWHAHTMCVIFEGISQSQSTLFVFCAAGNLYSILSGSFFTTYEQYVWIWAAYLALGHSF